jgi:hypothetical protein
VCTKGGIENTPAGRRGIARARALGWLSNNHDESNDRYMISAPPFEKGVILALSCRFAARPARGAR